MTLRLLVIEDVPADVTLMERHLRQHGVAAECRRVDCEADLDAALRQDWDVVLSDYKVPGMDFRATLKRLQEHRPDMPVILVSGSVGEENAVELLRLGLTDFILKDNLARLAAAIRRALDEAGERRAHRDADAALRVSEERLRLVLDTTNDGFWDRDLRSGMAFLSPSYYQMTGYDPGEVEPSFDFFKRIIHPDDRARVVATLEDYMRGRSPFSDLEFRMITGSGAIIWIRGRGRVVAWDGDGKPLRMVGTVTDITARKAADEALRRQAEELAERNAELERFNQATVGREVDMIALKEQVNELSRQLGRVPPYPLKFLDAPDMTP